MDWPVKQLTDVVESFHQGLNTAGEKIKFVDSGFPIIQTRNLSDGKIDLDKKIKYLLETKKTRISINKMKNLIKKIGYSISKESNWFIRPAYSFRFGLPKIINPFSWIPILNEIFCNGMLFLLKKEEA